MKTCAYTTALWFLFLAGPAAAGSPGIPEKPFSPIPLSVMAEADSPELNRTRDEVRFQLSHDPGTWVEFAPALKGGVVSMQAEGGAPVQVAVEASCAATHLRALAGDLNLDGVTEFVLLCSFGGNGLIAGAVQAFLVLSVRDTYQVTSVDFIEHQQFGGNFVLVDGAPALCALDYYPGENIASANGVDCNLWVYHLLRIEGASIRVDNALHGAFPRLEEVDAGSPCLKSRAMTPAQESELLQRLSPRLSVFKPGPGEVLPVK
jgi:hypothetical protein